MRAPLAFRAALAAVLVAVWIVTGGGRALLAQAGLRERTMFVSALTSRGDPVEGLGPSDFVITEDGRRREVLRVTPASDPIDIALLVDNSAPSQQAIPFFRRALSAFVRQMQVGNQIALVTLAERPTISVDYTSSQVLLDQGIGRLFADSDSGMTLLDAIVEVSAGLHRRDAPRTIIVVLMTNGIEFSNRSARDVIRAMRAEGVGLHAFVIGQLPINTSEDRDRALVLAQGTAGTGQYVTLLLETAAEPALQKLARELTSQYKVVYGRPESLIPPDKIEVESARRGVTMRGTPARGETGGPK